MRGSGAVADRIGRLTGLAVREARVVGAQHGYQHLMITLSGGRRAFAKATSGQVGASDPDRALSADVAAAFAAEANGLRWLGEAAAVPVPEVLAIGPEALVISMIPPGRATPEAGFGFGTDLARLHAAGADRFGAPSLDRILVGYNDTVPLAAGWRSRIPLHQLHPLLVHACLFGAAYRDEVRSAARAALAV